MIRRLPVIPTIVVVAAVAALVWLGVWQLGRANENEALIDRYRAAQAKPPIAFPTIPITDRKLPLMRYATGNCLRPVSKRTAAGENREGEPGYLIIVDCTTGAEGPGMSVELGWSKNPNAKLAWHGGLVSGIIVKDSKTRLRLVADTPPPGLDRGARPSPENQVSITPARNRGYAATWFGLAAIALVIYGLALRKRWKDKPPPQ
jgi:surfeit locus 1 family protein